MDAGTLHKEIAKVCPVTNVTMGKPDDRATWAFNPKEGATQEQIDAGNNVIATIPMEFEPAPVPVPGEEGSLRSREPDSGAGRFSHR